MIHAMFPGSFDPLTNGHLNIINRASSVFDQLSVVVANNTSKHSLFTPQERRDLIQQSVSNRDNVDVLISQGLTIDFAHQISATVLVRGMRNTIDFEYEKGIADLSQRLSTDIETIVFFTDPKYESLSSSMIKEFFRFNADLTPYLPPVVWNAMRRKRDEGH